MDKSNYNEKKYFAHETAVIDEGATIGKGSKIWHFTHISSASVIGENVNIGQNCFIADNVTIGNNVKIQNNVSVYEGVIVEDYAFLGPSMVFTNVRTPRSEYPRNTSADYRCTKVMRGASIGANATIVAPVTVGRCSFVGAGATVTKDVPDYAVVYGNPAKIQGYVCACGDVIVSADAKRLDCDRCHTHIEISLNVEKSNLTNSKEVGYNEINLKRTQNNCFERKTDMARTDFTLPGGGG